MFDCRCAKFAENGARGNPAANHRGLSRRPRVVRGRSLLGLPAIRSSTSGYAGPDRGQGGLFASLKVTTLAYQSFVA